MAHAQLRGLYGGQNGVLAMAEQRMDNTTYKYNSNGSSNQSEYIKDFTDDANNPVSVNKYYTDYTIIAWVSKYWNQLMASSLMPFEEQY